MNDQEPGKEINVEWLKDNYFSHPGRRTHLKRGDILLHHGEHNERLYLILEGRLSGYFESDTKERFEIFNSGKDQFVGVYSFFSKSHQSYSTVVAETDTWLAYIDSNQPTIEDRYGRTFAEHFLPVTVHEIYMRQLSAQRISLQNQSAMRRLYEAEKMVMLGQMAAGLAHELNNAIGVIKRKADWIADRASDYIKTKEPGNWYHIFKLGFEEGQRISSLEIRKRRKELQEKYDLSVAEARQLAITGLSDQELKPYAQDILSHLPNINYFYETGLALHDMLIAASHAASVVQSVKELAVTDHNRAVETDINQTIREAISLLKDVIQQVDLQIELQEVALISANSGELVQIWINLIKNACESLLGSDTDHPRLWVKSFARKGFIEVQVIDNGPGISEDLLPRIFQPNVTTKVKGLSFGLGLGLSIVQKLVESYAGDISVESRPGKTTFLVRIPIK